MRTPSTSKPSSTSRPPASAKPTPASSSKIESSSKTSTTGAATNLTGTWSIKFKESPDTKTHIMAVKVMHKGTALSATGVDQYGDVILTGTVLPPNKISFKRTYKGTQVNPIAQYEGTYTPATVLTPITAKGAWSAQPFADKSLKPKASSNSGDWEANIFTGPAINK